MLKSLLRRIKKNPVETPDLIREEALLDSPCLKVCQLDMETRHCVGCRRSAAEIANWTRLSRKERHEILADLPARQTTDGR